MVGFVNICHSDYVSEVVIKKADDAVKAMKKRGLNIYQIKEPVVDSHGAEKAGIELVKNGSMLQFRII